MALARAADFVRAFPEKTVLVVSVELATLTFQRGDLSQANLISCVLFGDGAAAAVVTGREASGPRIVDTTTYTFPHSLDAMGFDLRESGFHIVLSKDVPHDSRRIRELVDGFLARRGLTRKAMAAFLLLPEARSSCRTSRQLGCAAAIPIVVDCSAVRNLSTRPFVRPRRLLTTKTMTLVTTARRRIRPGFSAELLLLHGPSVAGSSLVDRGSGSPRRHW